MPSGRSFARPRQPRMTTLLLFAIVGLVLVNGFFVAAEFALVSARRGQLRGDSLAARLARRQQEKLDEYLSAAQLGITIASLALGAIGEPTLAHLIEPVLHSVALAHVAGVLGSILALLVMTVLHITAGEQAPKSFAIGSAVKVAKFCAIPLEAFHRTLRPLMVVLNNGSNALVRLFGGTPASSHAQQASLEELRQLIGGLTEEGELDQADAQLLQGVFTLDERRAGGVMTPRTRVTAMREGQTVREALVATRDAGHGRFPLLDRSGEQLLGVVYGRELTEALLDEEGERPVESFRHELLIVPPTLPLDVLLARMQEQRTSICAVVDEYGVLDGVATVEDILEEIVGEIWDEDDLPSGIRRLPDGRIVCRGDTSLLDLEQYGVQIEGTRASTSIGGVIQDSIGRLARPDDRLRLGSVRVRVLSTTTGGRIKRVLLAVGALVTSAALYAHTELRPGQALECALMPV
jgi:CBS domain containing-hemolysin-like protein